MTKVPARKVWSIAARNAVPVAGMALLGWKAQHLVMLYFVDTFVSLVCLLTILLLSETREPPSPDTLPGGMPRPASERFVGLVFIVVLVGLVVGFALGAPVLLVIRAGDAIGDPGFLVGAAIQGAASLHQSVIGDRELRGSEPDAVPGIVHRRATFVVLRWVALFATALILPFAPVMVVAYVAASVYLEMRPPKLG